MLLPAQHFFIPATAAAVAATAAVAKEKETSRDILSGSAVTANMSPVAVMHRRQPSSSSSSGGGGGGDDSNRRDSGSDDQEEDNIIGNGNRRRNNNSSSSKLLSPTEKCRVCGDQAAKHVHYGSVACFSCRAFFRRSILDKSVKRYNCRRNGNCIISLKSRKSCQKCRLDKCLQTGMQPEGVLSKEEKNKRFRKANAKKQSSNKEVVDEEEDEGVEEDEREIKILNIQHVNKQHVNNQHDLNMLNINNDVMEDANSDEVFILEPSFKVSPDEVQEIKRISLEHDSNYKSLGLGEELIKEVIMCSVFSMPQSPSAAMTGYRLSIQRAAKVAHAFGPFMDLSPATRSALLKHNADTMVSLRGAVFFEERKGGLDQILFSMGVDDLLVGKKLITTTMKKVGHMKRIDYRNFNSLQVMHENPLVESRYDTLLSKVGQAVVAKQEFVRLLSYIILFSVEDDQWLLEEEEERAKVEMVRRMFVEMLRRFVLSQYPAQVAESVFQRVLGSLEDLRELTDIKKQRQMALPASSQVMALLKDAGVAPATAAESE